MQNERDKESINLVLTVIKLCQWNFKSTCNLMGHTWPSFSQDHIDLVLVLKTLVFCSHYCCQSSFLDDPMSMLLTVSLLCICSSCITLINVLDWMKVIVGITLGRKSWWKFSAWYFWIVLQCFRIFYIASLSCCIYLQQLKPCLDLNPESNDRLRYSYSFSG